MPLPQPGTVKRICLSNGAVRIGKILEVDADDSGAMVKWIDYPWLRPQWVSRSELE